MNFDQFQMIDKVIALDKDKQSISCMSRVPHTASILSAHFPGFPILPGVLMIETIAQAAGFLFVGLNGLEKMAILFGVEKARFRQLVKPDSELIVHVQLVRQGSGYAVCQGDIYQQEHHVARVEVRLHILDMPSKETQQLLRMRCIEAQLPL